MVNDRTFSPFTINWSPFWPRHTTSQMTHWEISFIFNTERPFSCISVENDISFKPHYGKHNNGVLLIRGCFLSDCSCFVVHRTNIFVSFSLISLFTFELCHIKFISAITVEHVFTLVFWVFISKLVDYALKNLDTHYFFNSVAIGV